MEMMKKINVPDEIMEKLQPVKEALNQKTNSKAIVKCVEMAFNLLKHDK